jgi:hypothetical protein
MTPASPENWRILAVRRRGEGEGLYYDLQCNPIRILNGVEGLPCIATNQGFVQTEFRRLGNYTLVGIYVAAENDKLETEPDPDRACAYFVFPAELLPPVLGNDPAPRP